MSFVRAAFAVEVYGRIAWIIVRPITRFRAFAPEALKRGPGLDQGAVHREVLAGEQLERTRLLHHSPEELARHLVFQQPLAIGAEAGMVEARLVQLQIQEPAEQQVIVELLAQQPLTAHRVERHQQRGFEQALYTVRSERLLCE